ncbi:hypothetical protein IWZ00DRAFT_102850 [Phyllosticta capitalensis]|uniref:Secreted protein n=1 Tax=Phyllosticta capitalensis TaxID=121624 RepID=A0ABR1YCD3_9PEZI
MRRRRWLQSEGLIAHFLLVLARPACLSSISCLFVFCPHGEWHGKISTGSSSSWTAQNPEAKVRHCLERPGFGQEPTLGLRHRRAWFCLCLASLTATYKGHFRRSFSEAKGPCIYCCDAGCSFPGQLPMPISPLATWNPRRSGLLNVRRWPRLPFQATVP